MGRAWWITAVLHVIAVILFVTIPWQAPWRPDYIVLQPIDTIAFTPFRDTRSNRARGPTVGTSRREPRPETPPPPQPPTALTPSDTGSAMPAYDPNASALAPRVGDGRLWMSPRPALPGTVADALYGDTTARNEAAVARLRVMVDSLNQILDQVQRERQRPSWTVGGGEGGGGIPKFGIDSQYIHVAGIKIPTMALALLGNLLPQGNFDEAMRGRQLQAMREDILRAADRAQTFQDFRRYVHELRERKQAERDAERRRRAQDTTTVIP